VSDWLHGLPLGWMALVVFGATGLVTAAIHWIVLRLATDERARTFKGVSPGLLPPLGIMFGLLVAFIAAQVWGDIDRATAAVNREASSLRAVILLSRPFPADAETRMVGLIERYVQDAQRTEWPAMARQRATLSMIPTGLADALQLAIELPTVGEGQVAAQREIVANLDNALDARRQRILVSRSEVNVVKWFALIFEAVCTLVAIAIVHSDSRATTRYAMGLFAAAIAACIFLLVAHDRPFIGELSVRPTPLLHVPPGSAEEKGS
jgi:hypothetical protein